MEPVSPCGMALRTWECQLRDKKNTSRRRFLHFWSKAPNWSGGRPVIKIFTGFSTKPTGLHSCSFLHPNRCLSTQIFYLAAAWDSSQNHHIKITADLTKGKSPKWTCTVTVKTPPFRSTRSMFKCSTENSSVLTAEQCFLILCLCLLVLTWARSQQESTIIFEIHSKMTMLSWRPEPQPIF